MPCWPNLSSELLLGGFGGVGGSVGRPATASGVGGTQVRWRRARSSAAKPMTIQTALTATDGSAPW